MTTPNNPSTSTLKVAANLVPHNMASFETLQERIAVALDTFAEMARWEERERCCSLVFGWCDSDNVAQRIVDAIRARNERKGEV